MKENLTEIVFILDRSGSMSGLELNTIKGYNDFINEQKMDGYEATLSTILFDNVVEVLHDRVDIKKVKPLTQKDYYVRGSTALMDAVGLSIDSIGDKLANTLEENRPGKVLFVITTDGMENASTLYTKKRVNEMITHQREKYSWDFIFLGANINAIEVAEDLGILEDMAVNFCCDEEGVALNYGTLAKEVNNYMRSDKMSATWKGAIDADYNKRKSPKK